MMRAALIALALALLLLGVCGAQAHDRWADGSPVPPWVKSMCCGPNDVHELAEGDAWQENDGWHFRDLDAIVPDSRVLPSQDGHMWGFWYPAAGRAAAVYCFFVPMGT